MKTLVQPKTLNEVMTERLDKHPLITTNSPSTRVHSQCWMCCSCSPDSHNVHAVSCDCRSRADWRPSHKWVNHQVANEGLWNILSWIKFDLRSIETLKGCNSHINQFFNTRIWIEDGNVWLAITFGRTKEKSYWYLWFAVLWDVFDTDLSPASLWRR